ncbi:hypothetical protein CYY_003895 [Polysphondylium violaceum]|uniref:Clathrin/coatomer adaptor adaptin-like N-terminal domain-containing protein n=1 Tax=Polysphondylium violaceum TaxID=133409 RepID=A0A8J4V5N2_9MYCE|nr:hypothetical protein CYY_003895 [Polysphondylium violaceum]
MENEIFEELNSSESIKQISGLSKLNQNWINQGRDPTFFYTSILKLINETDNKTARILCYNILKSCKCTPSDWQLAIPLLVKDLNNDDPEIVISILKALPHISSILNELLMVGNADFGPLVRHSNQSIRRTALDTLTTLLFYRKSVLSTYKSFVSTGWELMVDRILEEQTPSVYQSAFNAISTLFSEVSRSVSHSDELDNSIQKRQVLLHYADWISSKLIDHFDLLLSRAQFIDINQRHVTVNTLTYLADTISRTAGTPYWPSAETIRLSVKQKHVSSPQNVVSILVDYFLAQLGSTNDSLVFAVGKAILDLLLTQQNQHNESWIHPVLSAFIGLLKREGISLNPLPILLAIMGVLPMLNDDLLFSTLNKIFPSIKTITDSNQRVSYLIRTFELIIDRHVTSSGKGSLFTPLIDTCLTVAFQDETSSFRDEIVISMVASHHNILTKHLNESVVDTSSSGSSNSSSGSGDKSKLTNSNILFHLHQAALNISEVCLKCILWNNVERISALEYCVRFVDWLCRVTFQNDSLHSPKLISLLRTEVLEQIPKIPSDYICLQSIFLICNHLLRSPTNKVYEQSDSSLLISVLRRRFLFLDNQTKFIQYNGSVRDMVMGIATYGRVPTAVLHTLGGQWLGALECLYLLGLHIPSAEATVQRTLDDILATYPTNKSVYYRARFIKKMLFSSSSSLSDASSLGKYSTIRSLGSFTTNNIDFAYCIPIESLDVPNSLKSTNDIFAYECKKAITGLAGVHYGSSIRDKPSKDVCLLSGVCDPIWIEVYHTAHSTLNTVTLHVQVTNTISFTIKNIVIMLGLSGHLEFPFPQTNCKHQIDKLLPDKSFSFEVPLSISGVDLNYVSFKVVFNHPSGVCEIDNTAQAKREKSLTSSASTATIPSPTASAATTGASTTSPLTPNNTSTTASSSFSSSSSTSTIPINNANSAINYHSTSPNTSGTSPSHASPLSNITNSSNNTNNVISTNNLNSTNNNNNNNSTSATTTTTTNSNAVTFNPIEIRCSDYIFDWNQFLIPLKYNKHQFIQQWPRFEAVYLADVIFEGIVSPQLLFDCLTLYPFHNVQKCLFSNSNFQFGYCSSTWFNEQISFIVTGMDQCLSPNEMNIYYCPNTTNNNNNYRMIHARFEFRASSTGLLASFQNVFENWIQKIPRPSDNFLARRPSPGEQSLFNITTISETPSPSTSSTNEEALLAQWKEKKKSQQTKLFSQLALDQDFY